MYKGICQPYRALFGAIFIAVIAAGNIAHAENAETNISPEENTIRIESGDLLQILVNGDEESITRALSGQFRIKDDGSIYYPALGRIAVGGKTLEEVADLIKVSLGGQVRMSGLPNVSVAEYAPVYLLGDAQKTGAFPYQPGMTVVQLLLSAGGLRQSTDVETKLLSGLSDIELTKFSLEVHRARLRAEIRGEDFNEKTMPPDSVGYTSSIVSTEVVLFAAHRRAKTSMATAYDVQRRTYDQEISSLEQSINLHSEDLELVKEDLKKTQDLSERGLVPRTRVSDLRRELVAVELRGLEFQTSLYRARQNRLGVEQKLAEAEIDAEARNLEALREVELQLTQIDRKMKTVPTGSAALKNVFGGSPIYTLLRRIAGTYQTLVVDENAPLRRGDVLRVQSP